ncbi:MAG: ABC transporter ATP-binding protein [Oscillospiraceae bacterium]|jgi:iron complex transport system ATP-binding protein|nr:ABC transporter ATP-binding protein [Oscillospiraceae bacterium]
MDITVKNLSFAYGGQRVLEDVSFTARSGELLAVLGPNGVGKSTLFSCMLGLLRGERGDVTLEDKPVRLYPPPELAQRIAFVPQSHAPSFNYSVFDMVLMGTTARVGGFSAPRETEVRAADAALERVGISHLRARGYLQVSGGERQLTLIARALAQNAQVLIMDEPTANLDYGNQIRVLTRVVELAREGFAVIFSTHNPDHAFLFADRVLALRDGRVAAFGTPREAVTEALISSLYGVEVRLREEDGRIWSQPILPRIR